MDNQIALITGGLGGIGQAIALKLVSEGFFVIVNDKEPKEDKEQKKLFQKAGKNKKKLSFLFADVSDEKQVRAMVAMIRERFSHVDAVVHCAGTNLTQSLATFSSEDFSAVWKTNVLGSILVTRALLPMLEEAKSPRAIFISSANAFIGGRERLSYSASKSALLGLTRALATELAPHILVNSIVPGYINTQMFRTYTKEPVAKKIKKIPLKRIGNPKDVAGLVSFLCSKDSSYITGQCIHVNGGLYFG